MRKIILSVIMGIILAAGPLSVLAETGGGSFDVTFENPIEKSSIQELLQAVLEFVTQIGAVVSVLFVVYAGFLLVFAQGNETQLAKAKTTLFWALVGAVIVLGAFTLGEIIQNTANEIKG